MAVYLGSTALAGLHLGTTDVQKVYLGTTEIWSAASPVQLINAAANANTSVAIPAHQVGDLLVVCSINMYTTTAPTKPSASGTVPNWEYIDNANSASGSGVATACFKATATNTTSGTWGSASHMLVAVLRGQNATSPIGGHASVGGTGADSTSPSISLTHSDGSSVLLYFHSHTNLQSTAWDSAPSGFTRRASAASGFQPGSLLNTKNDTTSDGSASQTGGQSGWGFASAVVEVIN